MDQLQKSHPANHTEQESQTPLSSGNASGSSVVEKGRLPLEKIKADVNQTRKEFPEAEINALADSIQMNGLITPILVTQTGEDEYKIVDGERRFRAYKKLAADEKAGDKYLDIPVTIIQANNPVIGILANMARKVYNAMESAEALAYIQDQTGLTDGKLGELVEKSRSSVTEYIGLLKLPTEIREAAKADSCVPFRALKRLVALESPDEDKIAEYKKLVNKYRPKEQPKSKRERSSTAWTADRRAEKANTKIANLIDYIDKIEITDIKDNDKKQGLKEALDILLERIGEVRAALDK